MTISYGNIANGFDMDMVRVAIDLVGGIAVVKILERPAQIAGVTWFPMMRPVAVISYPYAAIRRPSRNRCRRSVGVGSHLFALTQKALWYVGAPIASNGWLRIGKTGSQAT